MNKTTSINQGKSEKVNVNKQQKPEEPKFAPIISLSAQTIGRSSQVGHGKVGHCKVLVLTQRHVVITSYRSQC